MRIKHFLMPGILLLVFSMTSCFTGDIYIGGLPFSGQDRNLRETQLYPYDASAGSCLGASFGGRKILLIPIDGVIGDSGFLARSATTPGYIQRVLNLAGQDPSIGAILLRIDSPGGTVSASDLIYEQISDFARRRNIPVYAHISNLGASGAYYVAMSSDHINARPTAMVGSIGVILRSFTVHGLMEKFGVDYVSIASGDNKDTLSPFRPMREDEEQRLQQQIHTAYEHFLEVILQNRSQQLSSENLRKLADGSVYTAEEAKSSKLIDSIGYLEAYVEDIKARSNLGGAVVVAYLPEGVQATNLYEISESMPLTIDQRILLLSSFTGARLYYLWEAGI